MGKPKLRMYSGLLDGGKILAFVSAYSTKEVCQMVTDAGHLMTAKLLKMHWLEVPQSDWGQGGIPNPQDRGMLLRATGASLESVLLRKR